jgi:hypothetical protein
MSHVHSALNSTALLHVASGRAGVQAARKRGVVTLRRKGTARSRLDHDGHISMDV